MDEAQEAARKLIEPEVRSLIADVLKAKALAVGAGLQIGPPEETLEALLAQIEFKLGGLLPPIHATLNLRLSPAQLQRLTGTGA